MTTGRINQIPSERTPFIHSRRQNAHPHSAKPEGKSASFCVLHTQSCVPTAECTPCASDCLTACERERIDANKKATILTAGPAKACVDIYQDVLTTDKPPLGNHSLAGEQFSMRKASFETNSRIQNFGFQIRVQGDHTPPPL